MCKIFKFRFMVDQLKPRDIVTNAELRLHVSPTKTTSVAAKVSLMHDYELLANSFKFSSELSVISPSVIVYGEGDRWVTFNVTRLVNNYIGSNKNKVELYACLENIYPQEGLEHYFIESLEEERRPELVVYTFEKKAKKRARKNKLDILANKVVLDQFRRSSDRLDSDSDQLGKESPRPTTTMVSQTRRQRRRRTKRLQRRRRTLQPFITTAAKAPRGDTTTTTKVRRSSPSPPGVSRTRPLGLDRLLGDDPLAASNPKRWENDVTGTTKTRRKGRRRPRKKTPCARSPLYVDFEEIGWDSWIIAPSGYNVSIQSIFELEGNKIIISCSVPVNRTRNR